MSKDPHSWLDKYIEEQKENREILQKTTFPCSATELQEIVEANGWIDDIEREIMIKREKAE